MIVKHSNGEKEEFSLDKLAASIDTAFRIVETPHESYLSQIIAKASFDSFKKHYIDEIPACVITIYTHNIMYDLSYIAESKIYAALPYIPEDKIDILKSQYLKTSDSKIYEEEA